MARVSPQVRRYLLPLLLVVLATGLTLAVRPLFDGKSPLLFFVVAVVFAAANGGLYAGLLGTALSLAMIFTLSSQGAIVVVLAQSSTTMFAILGVAISVIVSKLYQANSMLAGAKEKLEAQSRALTLSNDELRRFAYTLAHDLHNPLRSVRALTDLLLKRNEQRFDESSKECARMVGDAVNRMESLINGLLDYAAAVGDDSGAAFVDCNAIVNGVTQDLRQAIEETGAVITVDRLPQVAVNEAHLIQVFSNLISNAIKYRSALRPDIRISAAEQSDAWVFSVRDNGIGFNMEFAEDIFIMLRRLHGASHEGNGIGLALCRAIVQRHGGKIWAESQPGKGSQFYFSLPKSAAYREKPRLAAAAAR